MDLAWVMQYVRGEKSADLKGMDVFKFLAELALEKAQAQNGQNRETNDQKLTTCQFLTDRVVIELEPVIDSAKRECKEEKLWKEPRLKQSKRTIIEKKRRLRRTCPFAPQPLMRNMQERTMKTNPATTAGRAVWMRVNLPETKRFCVE